MTLPLLSMVIALATSSAALPNCGVPDQVSSVQLTATLVTLAPFTVPEALATTQVCANGWVATVTLYDEPSAMALLKLKLVLPLAGKIALAPLSRNSRPPPVKPLMLPLTVYVLMAQLT